MDFKLYTTAWTFEDFFRYKENKRRPLAEDTTTKILHLAMNLFKQKIYLLSGNGSLKKKTSFWILLRVLQKEIKL